MAAPPDALVNDARVVIHLDLDAFYAQVEAVRLGVPRTHPLAVRQWLGLIAVSYAARERGVTRFMSEEDALRLSPDLVLVHVETLGADGASDGGVVVCDARGVAGGPRVAPGSAAHAAAPSKATRKSSLARYRAASAAVMATLRSAAGRGCVVEKASIDEVYVDATPAAARLLADCGPAALVAEAEGAPGAAVLGGGGLDAGALFDGRLAAGAALAARLRAAVLREHGTQGGGDYTCSAGIAHNRLVAKVASAHRKPDAQTVVPRRGVPGLLSGLPLAKLPGFGGKLGAALEEAGAATVGDVAALPPAALLAAVGGDAARAAAVAAAAAGECAAPVADKGGARSLLSAKSFDATSEVSALHSWIRVLATELAGRVQEDGRHPRGLVLTWRQGRGGERSASGPAPRAASDAAALETAARALLRRALPHALPCTRLALAAVDFDPAPAAGGAAITRFLIRASGAAAMDGGGDGWGGGGAPPAPLQPPAGPRPAPKKRGLDAFLQGGGGSGPAAEAPRHAAPPSLPAARQAAPTAAPSPLPPAPPPAPEPDADEAASTALLAGEDVRVQAALLREIEDAAARRGPGLGFGTAAPTPAATGRPVAARPRGQLSLAAAMAKGGKGPGG